MSATRGNPRVAIVHSGEPGDRAASRNSRYDRICEEFQRCGAHAEPAPYRDEWADDVRRQLGGVDAALVWVDPLQDGRDRSVLDGLLREVAAGGGFVSAHPDTILQMGTKEVLYQTRAMGWSSGDIHLYRSVDDLRRHLPARLADRSPRVLKQNRGNGGNGVWRIELAEPTGAGASVAPDPAVRVLHGLRGSRQREMPLSRFIAESAPYFERSGQMIDQPFRSPVPGGMVRCYLTHGEVVGFGHQYVTALLPGEDGAETPPPQPRLYYPPSQPEFQALSARMEAEWVPQLRDVCDLAAESLPVIWDADFLVGPGGAAGEATPVLCEINVSCVSPFPDAALPKLAEATLRRIQGRA